MSMERQGMDPGASGMAIAIKPLFTVLSLPLSGWAIDRFKLCPAHITNIMSIGNGIIFMVWPTVLGKL